MVGACAPYETQSAVGHGDGFARPTLSARYRFSQETFARTVGQWARRAGSGNSPDRGGIRWFDPIRESIEGRLKSAVE